MNIHLVVNLDGTLIHTDMLHESTLRLPFLLARGKAILKRHVEGIALLVNTTVSRQDSA